MNYLAAQLGIADASVVKSYAGRQQTVFDHQDDLRRAYGLRSFTDAEDEFVAWADARAWNTGDGAKSVFAEGVTWLRGEKVLLPGVTTLARLVARVREQAVERLHQSLYAVLATVIYLEGKSVDDCLDLLDLLMTTELIGKAETATDKERARQHPGLGNLRTAIGAEKDLGSVTCWNATAPAPPLRPVAMDRPDRLRDHPPADTARALTSTPPAPTIRKEATPGPWNPAHPTRQSGRQIDPPPKTHVGSLRHPPNITKHRG